MSISLESPFRNGKLIGEQLYLAQGNDTSPYRPVLTGDVFLIKLSADPSAKARPVVILQHPCSMRSNGISLRSRLLVAQIKKTKPWVESDWQRYFAKMELPQLEYAAPSGKNWSASFDDLHLVPSDQLTERVACLSPLGINLLLQRWVHYSSRVVIPTKNFQEATEPFLT